VVRLRCNYSCCEFFVRVHNTSLRKLSDVEANVIVEDGYGVPVLEIRVVSLHLSSVHTLILKDTIYVPSMRRNLIFISTLDKCGYTFNFSNGKRFVLNLLLSLLEYCVMECVEYE
jgi:hypothetical protein